MKKIFLFAGLLFAGIAFGYIVSGSLNESEKIECLKWQREAGQYHGYYLLAWQKAQCDHRGITIDAPVK